MTITDMIARCTFDTTGDVLSPDMPDRPLRSTDGEYIRGFQELRFAKSDRGDVVVTRAATNIR